MLRVFGAFLSVFCLPCLIVHLDAMVELFGVAALTLFAVDLLLANVGSRPRASRMRGKLLL
jgi:hypothetical protein